MNDNLGDMFDLPADAIGAVQDGMRVDGQIQLPFQAPYLWWVRGEPSAAVPSEANKISGVKFFGGWAADEQQMISASPNIPAKFFPEVFNSTDGKSYKVYAARNMAIAQIGRRFRWITDEDEGGLPPIPGQKKKGRGHVQILAMAATYDGTAKVYAPWSPIVLSAKGLSAKALTDALQDWKSQTALLRNRVAKGLPEYFFYCHVGTFGPERRPVTVGKKGASNYITPPAILLPQVMDEEWIRRIYVGREVAAEMGEMAKSAAEWLHAWDNQQTSQEEGEATQPTQYPQGGGYNPQGGQARPPQNRQGQSQASRQPQTPPQPDFPDDWDQFN